MEMYDRNGKELEIGDDITFTGNGGQGRITEYLGAGTPQSGALVRVLNRFGQHVDIALKLADAEYQEPVPTPKYGV